MEKIERVQAVELGLKKYYTGRACRRGHYGERYSATGSCVECRVTTVREFRTRMVAAHAAGCEQIILPAHPADVVALREYANALLTARGESPVSDDRYERVLCPRCGDDQTDIANLESWMVSPDGRWYCRDCGDRGLIAEWTRRG